MLQTSENSIKRFSLWRNSRVLRLLLKVYIRFLKIRGDSREIAMGFALGLFLSMSPTMGIQMPLAILLAAVFKWSKLSAAIGVWVTNPLTAPFFYGLTYYIGAKLLGLRTLRALTNETGLSTFIEALKKAPELLGAMALGGIIIGLPLAVVGYFLSNKVVLKYQNDLKIRLHRQQERLRLKRQQSRKAKSLRPKRRRNQSI